MADEKTFTEKEHLAILADRLVTETAGLTAERDQLGTEKSDLESKLDVAESARVAAEQRAEKAEQDFEAFKAQADADREAAARKDERLVKAKEVASHLDDEFFKDEKRIARIVAMEDEAFDGYLDDLRLTSPNGTSPVVPRETAMSGSSIKAPAKQSAAGAFLNRRFIDTKQEG